MTLHIDILAFISWTSCWFGLGVCVCNGIWLHRRSRSETYAIVGQPEDIGEPGAIAEEITFTGLRDNLRARRRKTDG